MDQGAAEPVAYKLAPPPRERKEIHTPTLVVTVMSSTTMTLRQPASMSVRVCTDTSRTRAALVEAQPRLNPGGLQVLPTMTMSSAASRPAARDYEL